MAESGFYRAFEDRFRGTRESIDARLRVYLPFLAPLTEFTPAPRALDLGCGRGEWLELLQAQDFVAQGIDLDDGMLAACRERQLAVQQEDALTALAGTEDEGLNLVSGFHIAEHLPFDTLQTLVTEAFRVLSPGGLLILETPNPENILVASRHFYLDPTHHHPLPPPLLAFLPEYAGFAQTRILRLQESQRLHSDVSIGVGEVMGDVSPDYAVVAQKHGLAPQMERLNKVSEADYGITYEALADRFDARFSGVETTAATAQDTAQEAQDTAQEAQNTAQEARETARAGVETAKEIAKQAQDAVQATQAELHSLYNSRSWRVTLPLRQMAHVAREGRRRVQSTVVRLYPDRNSTMQNSSSSGLSNARHGIVVGLVKRAGNYAKTAPRFKRVALRVLNRAPGLKIKLRRAYLESNLVSGARSDDWSGRAASGAQPFATTPTVNETERQSHHALSNGINAGQRTPLEKHFHSYGVDE